MKKLSYIFLLSIAMLTACNDGDSDLSQLIADYDEMSGGNIVPVSIAFDRSAIDEDAEVVPTIADDPEYYNDYIENSNFRRTVTVTYDGETATVSGDTGGLTVSVDGAHVVINSTNTSMCYVLTGQSANGSFKIYSDHRFQLYADNLNLTNQTGAAINSQSGKTMYFVVGTGNVTLADAGEYTSTPAGEDEKATLFSEGQIVFSGTGQLTVTSNSKNAVTSDDYVRFRVGTNVYLTSMSGHGLKTNDGVFINGGVLNIDVRADGMKGISSDDDIVIDGGRLTVITEGNTLVQANDTSSAAAIKCDSTLTINGGELRLLTKGAGSKGINVNGDVYINGGDIYIVNTGDNGVSKAKGLKTDASLTVSSGHLYIYSLMANVLDAVEYNFSEGYTKYEFKPKFLEYIKLRE